MKSSLKSLCVGTCIGGLILAATYGFVSSLNPDHVRIEKLEYRSEDVDDSLYIEHHARDNQGRKKIKYYVDGRYVDPSTMGVITQRGNHFLEDSYGAVISFNGKLKKGEHALNVVLEDYLGNITSDMEIFEVK